MTYVKQTIFVLLLFMVTPVISAAESKSINRVSYQVTEQQEVANDEITVTMAVERNGQDATKLANKINQLLLSANATIKKYSAVKSSTSDYSIRPIYTRDEQLDHWRGASSITLKSRNIQEMIKLVQVLQKSLLIKSTRYSVSAELKENLEAGMIERALTKFKTRAALVSKNMGFTKHRLVKLNINTSGSSPRPSYVMANSLAESDDIAPPTFESGQSTLKVVVSGTIEMEVSP